MNESKLSNVTKEELEKYSQKKEEYYRQFCKEDTEKFHLVDGVCEFFDHLKEKDIPFELKLEAEKDMREAAEELRKIENNEGNYKIYDDVKSFMEDLEKDDE